MSLSVRGDLAAKRQRSSALILAYQGPRFGVISAGSSRVRCLIISKAHAG